jgi:hypothetical protein
VGTGLVRFSREVIRRAVSSPGWLIGDVDSSRLIGTALGGDVNLERNFVAGGGGGGRAWDLLGFCSTSCRMFFIAARSKPACIGRWEEAGLPSGGVDGLDKAEASPPELVIVDEGNWGAGEELCILGGKSSSVSTSPALFGELVFVFRLAKVAVDGGRTTGFCGVALVFFRENHPDFF